LAPDGKAGCVEATQAVSCPIMDKMSAPLFSCSFGSYFIARGVALSYATPFCFGGALGRSTVETGIIA
jgi:hypothetical protein